MMNHSRKLLLLLLLILCTLALTVPAYSQDAQPLVRVTADPSPAVVGDPVTVRVEVMGAQNLYGFQSVCTVNPAILAGVSAVPGAALDPANRFVIDSQFNGTDGSWMFAIGLHNPAVPFSGDGLLYSLTYDSLSAGDPALSCTFTAVNQDGQPLNFVSEAGNVLVEAGPTPPELPPSTTSGAVNGVVTFQNRLPDNAGIQVNLLDSTNAVVLTTTSAADGTYSFADVPAGVYSVAADAPLHLPAYATGLDTAANPTLAVPPLRVMAGDTDDNNLIDIMDAGLLGSNFNVSVPPAPAAGDLNNDGKIDIADLSLLGGNYTGESTPADPSVPVDEGPVVAMAVRPSVLSLALSAPLVRYSNGNTGSGTETHYAMAYFTIARALADGNRDAAVVDRFMAHTRNLFIPANQPDLDGCADARPHQPGMAALAIGWKQSDIRARFSAAEQTKVLLMGQAAVVASAFTNTDGPNQRTSMDGDRNCWPRGNPNYTEPQVGLYLAGAEIMGGGAAARTFLNGYNHAQFISQLNAAGLTTIANTFSRQSAATVEGVVKGDRYNLFGVNISSFSVDPLPAYAGVVRMTYSRTATAGDYAGQMGMLKEFDSRDAYGYRSSLAYSAYGWMHSVVNRSILRYSGRWSAGDSTARNTIQQLMRVGTSDLMVKDNGYNSIANGRTSYQDFTSLNNFGYRYGLDQMSVWMYIALDSGQIAR